MTRLEQQPFLGLWQKHLQEGVSFPSSEPGVATLKGG